MRYPPCAVAGTGSWRRSNQIQQTSAPKDLVSTEHPTFIEKRTYPVSFAVSQSATVLINRKGLAAASVLRCDHRSVLRGVKCEQSTNVLASYSKASAIIWHSLTLIFRRTEQSVLPVRSYVRTYRHSELDSELHCARMTSRLIKSSYDQFSLQAMNFVFAGLHLDRTRASRPSRHASALDYTYSIRHRKANQGV